MTGGGAGSTPDKNGDMFQAPPRRDSVSPFEPDGQPRGAAPTLQGGSGMRSPEGATENSPGVSPEISGATRVSPVRDERK